MKNLLESTHDFIETLKEHAKDYTFIATNTLGHAHYMLQNHPEPELDNVFYMALYKEEGVGEDGLIKLGRDYEIIRVKVESTRIGKTKEGILCCFCDVSALDELPEWYMNSTDKYDRIQDFSALNISSLSDCETWVPTGNFHLRGECDFL
jgi:hypothetical protein